MNIIRDFVKGVMTVLTVTASPQLYRYPYRGSAEGLRGDMLRVGQDMFAALNRLPSKGEQHNE